jgi:AraC-like DNA-binding protein
MKPIDQKLPLPQHTSFEAQTVNGSWFQTGLHQHIEYELILLTHCSGNAYIGEYEGKFESGDIFFIGSNLTHAFKCGSNKSVNAVVIQFGDNCLGNHFMSIPECRVIKGLLEIAGQGLQVTGNSKQKLKPIIKSLETANAINRIITLLQCLEIISSTNEYQILTKKKAPGLINKTSIAIDKVIEFTQATYDDRISLSQVAAIACMSIPSFCHCFKQGTGKRYFDYLNEVRINNACRQLLETNKPITEICYENGYNTIVHFHRQFLRLKKITPLQYRKTLSIQINELNGLPAVA